MTELDMSLNQAESSAGAVPLLFPIQQFGGAFPLIRVDLLFYLQLSPCAPPTVAVSGAPYSEPQRSWPECSTGACPHPVPWHDTWRCRRSS